MFSLHNDSVIYVVCPAVKKTGGTELAHQLAYELNDNGLDAVITYYGEKVEKPTPEAFQQYVSRFVYMDEMEDDPNNLLIVPEINYDYLTRYDNIQKCIWWMSVDNYLKRSSFSGVVHDRGVLRAMKAFVNHDVPLMERKIKDNVTHFYQSDYACDFLTKRGFKSIYRLSDYINDIYLQSDSDVIKENIVLYNPKKGYKFTKKIIDHAPDIKWVALENMTNDEVRAELNRSKVYIDFGNHPGKDRFPREAAISGCCVITGLNGSAKYHSDVPIDDEFKFEATFNNIPAIVSKIHKCLENYESENLKFLEYREMIKNEKETFKNDVKSIFGH